MYLRIELYPQDRTFHRFLWRDLDSHKKPTEYEFNRLVNSSPFLAQLVPRHHATIYEKAVPKAAETVLQSTYMDDSMDSVLTHELGVDLYEQLSELWSKAGMHTHKWLLNSPAVLSKIPLQDRANKINLEEENLPSVRMLGVMLTATKDVFTFDSQVNEEFELTKRNFFKEGGYSL